jgi:hypothetical protein
MVSFACYFTLSNEFEVKVERFCELQVDTKMPTRNDSFGRVSLMELDLFDVSSYCCSTVVQFHLITKVQQGKEIQVYRQNVTLIANLSHYH